MKSPSLQQSPQGQPETVLMFQANLTKREYFAAMAMQGLLSGPWASEDLPKEAVEMADALLEALEQ